MSIGKLILLVFIPAIVVAWMPILIIWSLNVVFGFSILYTWQTWAGIVVLAGIIAPARLGRK